METEQANEAKTTVPDAQTPPTTDTQGTQPTDSETQSSNSDTSLQSQEKPPEDVTESDTMDSTAPQPPPPPPPPDSVSDHTVLCLVLLMHVNLPLAFNWTLPLDTHKMHVVRGINRGWGKLGHIAQNLTL